MMDCDDFRAILKESGVGIWNFIEAAISVACLDYGDELKDRRDGIVSKLYTTLNSRCRNCSFEDSRPNEIGSSEKIKDENKNKNKNKNDFRSEAEASIEKDSSSHEIHHKEASPSTPQSINNNNNNNNDDNYVEDQDHDRIFFDSADHEQTQILAIKELLEDPDQSDDSLTSLLQNLLDMDITFKALKKTDIGRQVNRLRKHASAEVRRLVKLLVRKWKDLVDEWVKSNSHGENSAAAIIADGDSPQQMHAKSNQNGNQVPDFWCSPNSNQNGSSGSDKHNPDIDLKGKAVSSRREIPVKREVQPVKREMAVKRSVSPTVSASANKQKEMNEGQIDPDKLASATRRLHENYQEAQNAKKQRTIQKLDLHDIPKPKNSFFGRNKGGVQAKHW